MRSVSIFQAVIMFIFIASQACRPDGRREASSYNKLKDTPSGVYNQPVTIHQATLEGKINLVRSFLEKGIDVNILDEEGRTPLMYAAFNGHHELIKLLIEKGAAVEIRDGNGRTALMMASSGPFPVAVKLLLDKGADPNSTDREEHYSPLMYAAAEGHIDVVKILLAYRADPSLKDADGDDALTFALNNGHQEVAALLRLVLKKGSE